MNNDEKRIQIAIDGPAGAGKSTVAQIVADKLDYIYVDTGAMYRAITLKALKEEVDFKADEELARLVKDTDISFKKSENKVKIFLDGADVTDEIRQNKVSNNVSLLAQNKSIRKELVKLQREIASQGGVVMDGRDIGTVVLADAELKIYLTASVAERAQRRYDELVKSERNISLISIKEDIIRRDEMDKNREISPLQKAEDAIVVDTTNLNIEEVVTEIINFYQEVE